MNPNPRYFRSRGGWILVFKGIRTISRSGVAVRSGDTETTLLVTFASVQAPMTMKVFLDEIELLMTAFECWLTRR